MRHCVVPFVLIAALIPMACGGDSPPEERGLRDSFGAAEQLEVAEGTD